MSPRQRPAVRGRQPLPQPRVQLDDGAEIALEGRVVARRDGGLAVRCRPVSDADLLLWIHLLIGALEDSPSHADVDPFGPLFA